LFTARVQVTGSVPEGERGIGQAEQEQRRQSHHPHPDPVGDQPDGRTGHQHREGHDRQATQNLRKAPAELLGQFRRQYSDGVERQWGQPQADAQHGRGDHRPTVAELAVSALCRMRLHGRPDELV
jgi:hypothetical protein